MTFPKNVKIGFRNYKINRIEPSSKLNNDILFGEIAFVTNEININSQFDEDEQKETLIHEILHGIDHMYKLDLDEDVVSRLSVAIYTVLKDNKWL